MILPSFGTSHAGVAHYQPLHLKPGGCILSLAALPSAGHALSCAGSPLRDRLQGLDAQGDLVLASGGLARLSGIRLPDNPPHREKAQAWLRAKAGQEVIVEGSGARDRWDRVSVRIRPVGDSPSPDLARGLVEAGLALVDPGHEGALCQPELLALEETSRERSLGLWTDARYKPIDVGELSRLRDRVGTFVLVEGRIRSVGERRQFTYLNFGGHWAEDFTIVIPRKTWTLMADRGLDAKALQGQRIRARGILQSWQGTSLTIVIPEMIERLEGRRLAR